MNLLFVSNYYPPESNAPANRLGEHAKLWAAEGGAVEVLTANPNFPEGKLHEGFKNAYSIDTEDGVRVTRVPMYISANRGTVRRLASYLSFGFTALFFGLFGLQRRPDLIVATTPQPFAALAGWALSWRYRVPFVVEIRDFWPESVVSVGAMKVNPVMIAFDTLMHWMYRAATHIVVVTDSFKEQLVQDKVPAEKISVLKNGIDKSFFDRGWTEEGVLAWRRRWGWEGRFVSAFVGTVGLAHRADILLEAAKLTERDDLLFVVVGVGAKRKELEEAAAEANSPHFQLLPKILREDIPTLLRATDANVVHLRKSPTFRKVIPSKIFESMAVGRPIIMGVEGESRDIVMEAGCALPVEPEDAGALLEAAARLADDGALRAELSAKGAQAAGRFDRAALAREYWRLLAEVHQRRVQK